MKKYIFPVLFLLSFVLMPAIGYAQNSTGAPSSPNSYSVPSKGETVTIQNPLGSNSFCGLVKALLKAAIQIGIPIAVLFIVYAGFKFVLAQGKPDALKKARENFLWTLIGISIFLGAWLLANVVANTVNALGGSQNIISCQ